MMYVHISHTMVSLIGFGLGKYLHTFVVLALNIITPRTCAWGKVIGCVVVVSTKIAISRDIGI